MLLINTFAISLSLVGSALAEYGSGSTPNYGSGAGDSSSVVAPSASTSSSLTAMRSASASGSSCSGGSTSVHVVRVSNKSGNLVYEPNDIKAAVGTMVQFQFYPKVCELCLDVGGRVLLIAMSLQNHSVVQSTFDQPCQPINNIMPNVPGFFSGFMPVAAKASTMPAWTVMINDTKPIWFYCSQGKHCQAGMVGVINA